MTVYGYLKTSTDKENIINKANQESLPDNIVYFEETHHNLQYWPDRTLGLTLATLKKNDILILSDYESVNEKKAFEFIAFLAQCERQGIKVYFSSCDLPTTSENIYDLGKIIMKWCVILNSPLVL